MKLTVFTGCLLMVLGTLSCTKKAPVYCWSCYTYVGGQNYQNLVICDKTENQINEIIKDSTFYECQKEQ